MTVRGEVLGGVQRVRTDRSGCMGGSHVQDHAIRTHTKRSCTHTHTPTPARTHTHTHDYAHHTFAHHTHTDLKDRTPPPPPRAQLAQLLPAPCILKSVTELRFYCPNCSVGQSRQTSKSSKSWDAVRKLVPLCCSALAQGGLACACAGGRHERACAQAWAPP